MSAVCAIQDEFSAFSVCREQFEQLIVGLRSDALAKQTHGEVEAFIQQQGMALLRSLLQAYLDRRTHTETRLADVSSPEGRNLNHVRNNEPRQLTTLFGDVTVRRLSYSQRDEQRQFPLDAALALPARRYSDGVRRRVVAEAIRGSFDSTCSSIIQTSGAHIAKRQALQLVQDVAQDFTAFYEQQRYNEPEQTTALLVLSFDGKGIVMRPDDLREATRRAATKDEHKLQTRLSQGEKRNRKRMAQVASVYTVAPHLRHAESVITLGETQNKESRVCTLPPRARNKRVWASVERDAQQVIDEAFQEALQRDPQQLRPWVVLVDGQPQQRKLIEASIKRFGVKVTLIQDFIHVLEYLWGAAWCFHDKGDQEAERWVQERALKLLQGEASQVAAGIRRSATKRKLKGAARQAADKCANYLLKNASRLRYDKALAAGYPIATGVIEGACRHLINDRLDITGARWRLQGAEAILKLRSLHSSGDWDAYWAFHKQQSTQRLYGHLVLKKEHAAVSR